MDSTRRVLVWASTVSAAILGAIIALPVAALLATAYYLRALAYGVGAFVRILGTPADQRPRGVPARKDRPPGRMAS